MTVELIDRRVLGAVRFLDAPTGLRIAAPLRVASDGVRWVRNRRGDYVVLDAPGFEPHTVSFDRPPAAPPIGSVRMTCRVDDPGGMYLARRFTLALPRDPDPAHSGRPDSLFTAAAVPLYPSPSAGALPGWAVIRASARRAGAGRPLAGAWIRVVRAADDAFLAGGMTDARGEAFVAVPGIPVTTWGDGSGAVLTREVESRIELVFDPLAADVPDPDELEAGCDGWRAGTADARLASGRTIAVAFDLA